MCNTTFRQINLKCNNCITTLYLYLLHLLVQRLNPCSLKRCFIQTVVLISSSNNRIESSQSQDASHLFYFVKPIFKSLDCDSSLMKVQTSAITVSVGSLIGRLVEIHFLKLSCSML